MDDNDQVIQPKSVIYHDVDYVSHLQRQLGVIDFDQAYSNFFAQCELAIKIVIQIEDAIKQKIINLEKHPELLLDKIATYKLKKLWDGQCYLSVKHDPMIPEKIIPNSELFHYGEETLDRNNPHLEIIPIPALDNMTPIGQIKQKTLLIEISQAMPMKYAFQGMDYATLVNDGNFIHYLSDGSFPKITQDDMQSITKFSYRISRDVYHRIMKKEKNKFIIHWATVYNNIHRIIEYLKNHDDDDFERRDTNTTSKLDRT